MPTPKKKKPAARRAAGGARSGANSTGTKARGSGTPKAAGTAGKAPGSGGPSRRQREAERIREAAGKMVALKKRGHSLQVDPMEAAAIRQALGLTPKQWEAAIIQVRVLEQDERADKISRTLEEIAAEQNRRPEPPKPGPKAPPVEALMTLRRKGWSINIPAHKAAMLELFPKCPPDELEAVWNDAETRYEGDRVRELTAEGENMLRAGPPGDLKPLVADGIRALVGRFGRLLLQQPGVAATAARELGCTEAEFVAAAEYFADQDLEQTVEKLPHQVRDHIAQWFQKNGADQATDRASGPAEGKAQGETDQAAQGKAEADAAAHQAALAALPEPLVAAVEALLREVGEPWRPEVVAAAVLELGKDPQTACTREEFRLACERVIGEQEQEQTRKLADKTREAVAAHHAAVRRGIADEEIRALCAGYLSGAVKVDALVDNLREQAEALRPPA